VNRNDKMKRIFIAVKVEAEEPLLLMLSSLKSGLSNDIIKWTSPDNIHITLAFLGDTEENMIKLISSMLKEKCKETERFELILKGLGVFRNSGDPRIIWTGIEPSEKLVHLYEIIMKGLKGLNIKLEDRPFNPHLTIGRIKQLNDKKTLRILIEQYQNAELQIIPVPEVILYESILLHSGPVYKPLAKFNLE
jgi:RNA 2',3'-cyclic 3'-phosphodiesterase